MKKIKSFKKFNIPDSIQKIIEDYVYGMNQANEKKILKVFDINSEIVGFFDDKSYLINGKEFSKFISKQESLNEEQIRKLKYEIIHYEISKKSCIIVIKNFFLNRIFFDTLHVIKEKNKWKIKKKIFLNTF